MTSSRRRRGSQLPIGGVIAGVVLLALVVGGAWYWLRPGAEAPPVPTGATLPDPDPTIPPPALEFVDLPPLDASDEFVRRLVAGLSAHPQLARWLVTDDLVRRFVGVVVDLAGGANPSEHLRFMAPTEGFVAETSGGRTVLSAASQRRYDLLAATYTSLDTRGSARLFQDLRPLVEEAYRELGLPTPFDEVLAMAVRTLVEARPVDGTLDVLGAEGIYVFTDPSIEERRGAEKVLLRMGPANTRRIQAKTRELANELGIPTG